MQPLSSSISRTISSSPNETLINLVFLPAYPLSPWDHHPTFYLYVTDSSRDLEDSDSPCSSVDWFSSCSICCCCLFAKSRLTLYDLIVYSPPGSSVCGILQTRILEWVAIPFSRGSFPTQGLNSGLLHYRQILYHLSHQGSPHLHNVLKIHPCCRLYQNFPCFKGWIIFHCMDVPQSLYLFTYWGTLGLLLRVCMLSRFSCTLLFVTLWTVALQAPPSMGLSRHEYWSGLPCPSPWRACFYSLLLLHASTPWLIRIMLLWISVYYQNSE